MDETSLNNRTSRSFGRCHPTSLLWRRCGGRQRLGLAKDLFVPAQTKQPKKKQTDFCQCNAKIFQTATHTHTRTHPPRSDSSTTLTRSSGLMMRPSRSYTRKTQRRANAQAEGRTKSARTEPQQKPEKRQQLPRAPACLFSPAARQSLDLSVV